MHRRLNYFGPSCATYITARRWHPTAGRVALRAAITQQALHVTAQHAITDVAFPCPRHELVPRLLLLGANLVVELATFRASLRCAAQLFKLAAQGRMRSILPRSARSTMRTMHTTTRPDPTRCLHPFLLQALHAFRNPRKRRPLPPLPRRQLRCWRRVRAPQLLCRRLLNKAPPAMMPSRRTRQHCRPYVRRRPPRQHAPTPKHAFRTEALLARSAARSGFIDRVGREH